MFYLCTEIKYTMKHNMADYSKFFKRDNFLASVKAAKERKQKWEKEVQQKWEELNTEFNTDNTALSI